MVIKKIIEGKLRSLLYFRQLSSLLISGNRLHVPQADWFRNVYHEKQLPESGVNLLNSNPWVCDCDAYSYWVRMKQ